MWYICWQYIIKKQNTMENQSQNQLLPEVEQKIITLRNQQVILDADVAELYEVGTRDINKAVKNNPEKFPQGYIFEISEVEKNELVQRQGRTYDGLRGRSVAYEAWRNLLPVVPRWRRARAYGLLNGHID